MNEVKNKVTLILLLACINIMPVMADPFQKGRQSVALIVGSGSSFDEDYIVLGAGYGYYVLDGLELGIDAHFWLDGDPSITKISPQVRYVFRQPKNIKPYIGAFFRRTYIEGLEDLDSVGYRAGLNFLNRDNFYLGVGVVYEDYQDCNETVYRDCSNSYPEILFSFAI